MTNPKNEPVPEFLLSVIENLALINGLSIDELYRLIHYQTDRQLTVRDIDLTVEWLLRKSGKPWAALEFGTQINIQQMGKLGPVIACCGTVREALDLFQRYHRLLHPHFNIEYERVGKRAALKMPTPAGISVPRWYAELLIGALPFWLYRLVDPDAVVHEVWFRHSKPDYSQRYYAHFECDVQFEQPYDCVWTNTTYLDLKLRTSAPEFHSKIVREAEIELRESLSFLHKVKTCIRSKLPDDCGIEEIASYVLCSERTLQRKLAEEGTSVKKLKQEVKFEDAVRFLNDTGMSIEQIAFKLGYEQRSNFGTAFQKWTGYTPAEWRAKSKSMGNSS